MGNVSSRPDEKNDIYVKDQSKLSISAITITDSDGKSILHIAPDAFPATRFIVKRDAGDDRPVEYVQNPESPLSPLLLKLNNDTDLNFRFTFFILQNHIPSNSTINGVASSLPEPVDTVLTGLTFVHASNLKELDNLVTREFHANPNLQNNSNVKHVGGFSTAGNPSVQFEWNWKWKPPQDVEDKGGGWQNCCSFLEYDQRTNRLNTLVSFSFWVHNSTRASEMQRSAFALRRAGSFAFQSQLSPMAGTQGELQKSMISSDVLDMLTQASVPTPANAQPASAKVDVNCQRPGEDMSAVEDGPLFRATMKALELKTGNMRAKMKKVLKKAEAAHQAQISCNDAVVAFTTALADASTSNANAIQPVLEHYFDTIAREILHYEDQNIVHLEKMVIEPLSKLYNYDIKQAESKKKDFDEESRDYYAYVGRYLGQRQDSLKQHKKREESDSKYQSKRRNFELKCFDYSSFMQDLHGGRKEQEVLSQLTKYADAQAHSYLSTAKTIETMMPRLQALVTEVSNVDKEFQFQRTEREEKRRALENNRKPYIEPADSLSYSSATGMPTSASTGIYGSDSEMARVDSTSSQRKGLREFDSRLPSGNVIDRQSERKEGLLWALSRPGSHIDPKGINKQAWHKFWIVLDQGKLSEYSNWKQKLDLHMEPIDLRMASVREARNADRRFCFEVITPQFKRIYQATSEEDMSNWIASVNNALQSAVEGRESSQQTLPDNSIRRDIGSVLAGKSPPQGYSKIDTSKSGLSRRTTVGGRPGYVRRGRNEIEGNSSNLLQLIRSASKGNNWCADCSSISKVEWVSINLGMIFCIECSGIHRSLGTHISKIRSLTLDVHSFSIDIVEILLHVGNDSGNAVWEATLDPSLKPTPQSNRDQRLKFITAKYSNSAYIQPFSPTVSRYATPEDTLIASIKKNDIQGVLYAIALRANLNATDRSRGTNAVFLALAATDPAPPSAYPVTPGTTKPNLGSLNDVEPKPFPIAELLVQNGAVIPPDFPVIPLSPTAQLYLTQRTMKPSYSALADTNASGATVSSTSDGSALFSIGDSAASAEKSMDINRSPSRKFQLGEHKDRDKLQKRGSAGARLAGKVASLGLDR